MTALDDHSQGLESQSSTIKNMKKEVECTKQELERTKQKLHNLEEFMKQELHDLKAAMVQNEQTKTSMVSAMDLMKGDLQKRKGSWSKPRTLRMCSLGLLLLATLIRWFLMGLNGKEAFRQLS
jgi:Flp pilus assembly protein TadB